MGKNDDTIWRTELLDQAVRSALMDFKAERVFKKDGDLTKNFQVCVVRHWRVLCDKMEMRSV